MSEKATEEELRNPFISKHSFSFVPAKHQTSEPMPKRKLIRWAKIGGVVFLLTIVLIIVSALFAGRRVSDIIVRPNPFQISAPFQSGLSHVSIDKDKSNIIFKDRHTSIGIVTISFSYRFISRSDDPSGKKCEFSDFSSNDSTSDKESNEQLSHTYHQSCYNFENQIQAAIYETSVSEGLECYGVHWYSRQRNVSLETCFDISSDNWYGGGELSEHRWPLNRAHVPMQPYITRKFNKTLYPATHAHFTSFLEPYFLSAQGVAILLDDKAPLFVSVNEKDNKKICFKSAYEKPYDKVDSFEKGINLKYMVCNDKSAKAIHSQLLESGILPHPSQAPFLDVLQKPIWSTRGQDISNETSLLSFVNSIKVNGLSFSQLFIDGNYSKSSGNFYFNERKFPHSAQIIMELDENLPDKKFKVGTEVFPYVPNFVRNKNFSFDIINSHADRLLLDIFNDEATNWFTSQLMDIQKQIHVTAFRFSGGDVASYLRHGSMRPLKINNQFAFNEITTRYSQIASKFKDSSSVGSGYKSQVHGLIADSGPLLSSWDHRKGLKSIIPTVITFGIIGYPFVSVGPVGGVGPDIHTSHFSLPPKNLYIRWLQLSIFLPVVEFSVGPWEYGPDVVNYTKSLLEYRQKVLWPQYLSAAVSEAVIVGM